MNLSPEDKTVLLNFLRLVRPIMAVHDPEMARKIDEVLEKHSVKRHARIPWYRRGILMMYFRPWIGHLWDRRRIGRHR